MNKPPKITNEQAEKILSEMEYREQIITKIMIETGLRVSDVLNIHIKNIEKGQITEKKTKKKKQLNLSATLADEVKQYIKNYYISGLLFPQKRDMGKPINRSTFFRALKRAESKTGVQVSPHSFRKLYAQNSYATTHDIYAVQKSMQHKYVETTAAYLDIDVQKLITAAAELRPAHKVSGWFGRLIGKVFAFFKR